MGEPINDIERRTVVIQELRAKDGEKPTMEGYAARFNMPADLGYFIEIIEPGFFDEVLGNDVRALWNHDANYVLGRISASTLELKQDDNGLYQVTYPPVVEPLAARWAQDAMVSVKRGDVKEMSFAFTVKSRWRGDPADGDEWIRRDGKTYRFLKKGGCRELFDVSPVTYPAYSQTSVSASTRSRFEQFEKELNPGGPGASEVDQQVQVRHARRLRQIELLEKEF
jgi:HK97 family phage prohead protease